MYIQLHTDAPTTNLNGCGTDYDLLMVETVTVGHQLGMVRPSLEVVGATMDYADRFVVSLVRVKLMH